MNIVTVTGSGTSGDPYVLHNFSELELIGSDGTYTLAKYYKLGANIDASPTQDPGYNGGAGWAPRGDLTTKFTGGLDGDGYSISNLYINRPETDNVGFFGAEDGNGLVKNLNLVNVDITGRDNVGALTGSRGVGSTGYRASMYVTVEGVVNGANKVGGIFGNCYRLNCYFVEFKGSVNGSGRSVGGIVGFNSGYTASTGYMEDCKVEATIIGEGDYVGGFHGETERISFNRCELVDSDITGVNYVGGLAGYNNYYKSDECVFTNVTINGVSHLGSAFGWYYNGVQINNSNFNDCTVIGTGNNVGGVVGFCDSSLSSVQEFDGCILLNCDIAGLDNVGGLAGNCEFSKFQGVKFVGTVSGRDSVGGVVGYFNNNSANSRFNKVAVFGTVEGRNAVGGVVGNGNRFLIGFTDVLSHATVISTGQDVGGLAGYLYSTVPGVNSYSKGAVSGSTNVGGLVGRGGGTFTRCFWDTETSGQASSAKGTGKTTAEMKDIDTYAGYDFDTIWAMAGCITEGYPALLIFGLECVCYGLGGLDSEFEFGCTPL